MRNIVHLLRVLKYSYLPDGCKIIVYIDYRDKHFNKKLL